MEAEDILAEVHKLSYNGNSVEDAIRFILVHERVLETLKSLATNNWSRKYIGVFMSGLQDRAADWKNRMALTHPNMLVEEWFRYFRRQYIPVGYDDLIYRKLRNLKENGRSAEYCEKFQRLEYLLQDPQDQHLNQLFKDGLGRSSRKACILKGSKDRSDCIELLMAIGEDDYLQLDKRNKEDDKSWSKRMKRRRLSSSETTRGQERIMCFGCGRSGHYKRNCPDQKRWNQ